MRSVQLIYIKGLKLTAFLMASHLTHPTTPTSIFVYVHRDWYVCVGGKDKGKGETCGGNKGRLIGI